MNSKRTSLALIVASLSLSAANAGLLYVDVRNANPSSPYSTWATAATNIQDAVDAALSGDEIVVASGLYAAGGRAAGTNVLVNRVLLDKPVLLRSVNGPQVTVIQGHWMPAATNGLEAVRCAWLAGGAVLSGFTLTNGATTTMLQGPANGGGVWCDSDNAVVTNCIIIGNAAGDQGGGAFGGMLKNCLISGNSAKNQGGGVAEATLLNCALVNNRARDGAGNANCVAVNCTLGNNSAKGSGGGAWGGTLDRCSLTNNTAADRGGGVQEATLNDCIVSGNSASDGGGAGWNCSLTSCLVSSNSASSMGGGASHSTLVKCTLLGNSCLGAGWGGGASVCTLKECAVTANSSRASGGGVVSCTVNDSILTDNAAPRGGGSFLSSIINCTVTRNSAEFGGGAFGCWSTNSIIYYNTAAISGPNCCSNTFDLYSCTVPLPSTGFGNITNEPLFISLSGGDFRLQPGSPCINAGNSAYVFGPTDLAGNPRIVGGAVDMGAYEFQNPTSALSYAWLQEYGLPTDGSADYTDTDSDGLNNSQEWRCQTVPTNAASALRLVSLTLIGNDVSLTWQSVAGLNYCVECSSNPVWGEFVPVANIVAGQDATTTYNHTNGLAAGALFYRIGLSN